MDNGVEQPVHSSLKSVRGSLKEKIDLNPISLEIKEPE